MATSTGPTFVSFRDFVDPQLKLNDKQWTLDTVNHFYYNGGAGCLLDGKDVKAIMDHAAGNQDTGKMKNMFAGLKKKRENTEASRLLQVADLTGIDYEPLGVLQQPLSAAISTLQKQVVHVNCRAIDATALALRKKDMERLRNRPFLDDALAAPRHVLKMPIESPGTQFNIPTVDINTLELDPSKEDELNLYADVFYKARPESAMEVAFRGLMYWNDFKTQLDLEKKDQVYFGVSSSRNFVSDVTGLPQYEYTFPGHVFAPNSLLPDYSDAPYLYIQKNYNAEQMLNVMGKESVPEEIIAQIFNDYWKAKGLETKWEDCSQKLKLDGIPVCYMEFKSFDVIRIERAKTKSSRSHSVVREFDYKLNGNDRTLENKYPQQTYYAYWVPGTEHILKHGKVLGTFRQKGKESVSRFSIQIYKSKDKSDVELCMPIVSDIQRAYTKLQHEIIMAKPEGVYFDAKYLRNAAESLKDDMPVSFEQLFTLFAQNNIMVGDTEDMDGAQAGNFRPFEKIPGGLGKSAVDYLKIIAEGKNQINELINYNALLGRGDNPEGLVGLQKMLVQSSINSLHYATKAIKHQVERAMKVWGPMVQEILKPANKNTEARKALENIMGATKVDVINDMDSLWLHHFGTEVEDAPTEEFQNELNRIMLELVMSDRLDLSDYFNIQRVWNYKDAQQLLVISEKKRKAEQRRVAQERNQAVTQAAEIQSTKAAQVAGITSEGEVKEEMVKAENQKFLQGQNARLQITLQKMKNDIEFMKKSMQGSQSNDKQRLKQQLDNQGSLA